MRAAEYGVLTAMLAVVSLVIGQWLLPSLLRGLEVAPPELWLL